MTTVGKRTFERSLEIASASASVLSTTTPETLTLPLPICVERGKGSRVYDVDGNEFIDILMGFGPLLLGHAHDVVVETIREAAPDGLQFILPNRWQEPLARLVVETVPCAERVLFCNSGTEATMHAIRALRAFTGRTKIAVFEGSYHGAHDYVLTAVDESSPPQGPRFSARKAGIPAETQSTVVMLPYWDEAAFELIRRHRDELALVMVEPVQGGNPQSGHVEWLRSLREVCSEAGVPFMLDEVLTGFRLDLGGAQTAFDVVPDVATFGKVLGGGLPIGAIAGRADIMAAFSKHGPGTVAAGREIWSTGTFSGNPLTMAAGHAALSHLRDNPHLYTHLNEQSDRLADEVNAFCEVEDIPARINGSGSLQYLYFGRTQPVRTRRDLNRAQRELGPGGRPMAEAADAFTAHLFAAGVLGLGVHHIHLSTAHSADDVDAVIAAMQHALLAVRGDGLC